MNVIDLPAEHEASYCQCLEEWSAEMKEAGTLKESWYRRMRDRGLRVKVAVDDTGTIGGMIHYGPIENVPVLGSDLYYMYCIWVHGYPQGRGNYQKRGMGQSLLQAAEDDAREAGAKGFVAWGLSLPLFMRASWFRKRGYRRADRIGIQELLWKPFSADAMPPRWARGTARPVLQEGKVVVTSLRNGWCPAQNLVFERAKRACADIGDPVVFREIDTFPRDVGMEWGTSDALYVDAKQIRTGPPPGYEAIRKAIARRVMRSSARGPGTH